MMSTNYENAKIYKIYGDSHNMVYYGSTTMKYLSQRLTKHKSVYKTKSEGKRKYGTSSCQIIATGDYKIILVEKFPCNDKDELVKRERYYIENFPCINIRHEGRTKKEYYQEHKEHLNKVRLERLKADDDKYQKHLSRMKKWREENKERNAKSKKEWYEKNKERISQESKEKYEKNKDKIKERMKKPYQCPCGSVVQTSFKKRHERTIKHKKWLSSQ